MFGSHEEINFDLDADVKISAGQVETISSKLVDLKSCIPNTFARKPRSLADVDRWKATEFRQFLLYIGKIVLNGILRQEQFEHFLCLSVASCILVCPMLAQLYRDYAKQLMEYFVEQGKILYTVTSFWYTMCTAWFIWLMR